AVASTTLSPSLTTAAPWACLANFPVSKDRRLPPASSTLTSTGCGFMVPFPYGQEGGVSAPMGGSTDEPGPFGISTLRNLKDGRKTHLNAASSGNKGCPH